MNECDCCGYVSGSSLPAHRKLLQEVVNIPEEQFKNLTRIAELEKELLAEQVLHNSAKKLNFTFSEIIKEQDATIAALREQNTKLEAVAEAAVVAFEEDDNDSGMLAQTHYNLEAALQEAGYLKEDGE